MNDILTQKEVDALLKGIDNGFIGLDENKNEENEIVFTVKNDVVTLRDDEAGFNMVLGEIKILKFAEWLNKKGMKICVIYEFN